MAVTQQCTTNIGRCRGVDCSVRLQLWYDSSVVQSGEVDELFFVFPFTDVLVHVGFLPRFLLSPVADAVTAVDVDA